MRNIVQKRITQDQMNSILQQEEEDYKSKLVKIFKETRIDQFDPDFFKNKIKMTTMKRVNEAQEKQFQNFFMSEQEREEGNQKSAQFLRNPRKFVKKFAKTKSVVGSLLKQKDIEADDYAADEETMPTTCRRT